MAVNIASGKGLPQFIDDSMIPVAHRTPAYPMFLAGVYSIFEHARYRYSYGSYLIIFAALVFNGIIKKMKEYRSY
jgi:hypothetical protein